MTTGSPLSLLLGRTSVHARCGRNGSNIRAPPCLKSGNKETASSQKCNKLFLKKPLSSVPYSAQLPEISRASFAPYYSRSRPAPRVARDLNYEVVNFDQFPKPKHN